LQQRLSVRRIHSGSAVGHQGRHLPIARLVRFAVVWVRNHEEWTLPAGAVPAGPGSLWLAEALRVTQAAHHRTVEAQGAIKVGHADEDMGQHAQAFRLTAFQWPSPWPHHRQYTTWPHPSCHRAPEAH